MKAELRRKQILESALKIFSQKGYYETHVEDIINDLKIGKGTIYQYFRNKEDIFIAILELYYEKWKENISVSHEDVKSNHPVDYLKLIITKTFKFFSEEKDFSNIYLRIAPGLKEDIEPLLNRIERMIKFVLKRDLKLAMRIGYLKRDIDIGITADIILGSINYVAYNSFIAGDDIVDIKKVTDVYVNVISTGIFDNKKI